MNFVVKSVLMTGLEDFAIEFEDDPEDALESDSEDVPEDVLKDDLENVLM